MSQLTALRIFNAIKGLFVSLDSTDETLLKTTMWRRTFSIPVTDGGTAGTAQTETPIWRNDTGTDVRVTSAYATVPVAITGHASNYATFTVSKRTAAGGSAATVASFVTNVPTTNDMAALAPTLMPLTDANVVVPAGYVLTGKVPKAASGVAIAAATSQAIISVTIEPVGS